MPEPASTQILETRLRPAGQDSSRVELVISDDADPENAETTITISLVLKHPRPVPFVVDLQDHALHVTVKLLREHTRILDDILEGLRH